MRSSRLPRATPPHRRTPSRDQRSTVAGRTSTSASLHRGHNLRSNSQSRRSVGRKRRCERARTPSWCRRASVSSRRSIRVARDARAVAAVLKPPRIAGGVPSGDGNVNGFYRTVYWRATGYRAATATIVLLCVIEKALKDPTHDHVVNGFRLQRRKDGRAWFSVCATT